MMTHCFPLHVLVSNLVILALILRHQIKDHIFWYYPTQVLHFVDYLSWISVQIRETMRMTNPKKSKRTHSHKSGCKKGSQGEVERNMSAVFCVGPEGIYGIHNCSREKRFVLSCTTWMGLWALDRFLSLRVYLCMNMYTLCTRQQSTLHLVFSMILFEWVCALEMEKQGSNGADSHRAILSKNFILSFQHIKQIRPLLRGRAHSTSFITVM